jgi:hypothetical protein
MDFRARYPKKRCVRYDGDIDFNSMWKNMIE